MKISVSDILFQMFLRGVVLSTMIHEYGHLLALRLLGVDGEIRASALNAVYPKIPLYGYKALVFYGGGGMMQALVFIILAVRNRDDENRLINIMIAVEGIIYGLFEALAPRTFWGFGTTLGFMIGALLIGAVIIWKKSEIIL
jgi:hypothetical protein